MTAKEFIKKSKPFKVGANYNVSPAKLEELLTEFAQMQKKEMIEALFENCENNEQYAESMKPKLKEIYDNHKLSKVQYEALILILENGGISQVELSTNYKRKRDEYIMIEAIDI